MGTFATFAAKLKLNIQEFSDNLEKASKEVKGFARKINGETVEGLKEVNKQTRAWGLNMKSVSRVVSGIVISQAFYRILQNVQAATNAVWEFTKQLEYAKIAYSNLFGDASLATEFINVLKDFAAKTPFSFTESEAAAKRLLAYGIEYKNVMYVLQGVLSAASIQGDSAKIEAISRAFGQIYTYGKLMTQEVRQLSEAGIPAYEILQEELGLTQEQLANLGHEGIPAAKAINALVDGIQKRFGSATVAAAKTITGIISNIKDNATMLFSSMFEPATVFIKSGLAALGDFLFKLREIQEVSGIGGVFEALFPPEMHGILRQFTANLSEVGLAVARLVYSIGGLLKPIIDALLRVFNAFAPILTVVINALAMVVNMITSNATAMKILTAALATAAAMWVIFKIRALATAVVTAVITSISKSLAVMSTVLTFVTAHPFWALLIGLGGVLVGISGGFGAISDKITLFFKKLTQFNGVDPDKVLLPSQKERANDLDKFNNKLEDTSGAMDDLADSTGKATKAAKGLLAFDEVFKLNEPDEGAVGIDVDGLEDLLEGMNGLGDTYMPEIPDFNDYMDALTGNFLEGYKDAWDKIKDSLSDIASTAIGAAFGGLLGKLLGGKLGGIFGAIAGAIVGYFWNMLADHFNLTPDQKINAGIIGGVGAAIGAILGGILGGPLGAKLGAVIGGLVGSFWGIFAEALGVTPSQHIATAISGALMGAFQAGISLFTSLVKNLTVVYMDDVFAGFAKSVGFSFKSALTGALKQGVLGAITGLATGMLANAITAWIAGEMNLTEQDLENSGVGQTIGSIVGSIAGLILGGPIGSLVGGALGQLAGSIVGEFWNYLSTALKGAVVGGTAGLPIGALVGTIVGSIGGPLGAALGAAIGVALGGLTGLIIEKWDAIKDFFVGIGQTIADGFNGLVEGTKNVVSNVTGFFSDMLTSMSETFSAISDFIAEKMSIVFEAISSVASGIWTVMTDIWPGVSTVISDIWTAITTVLTDISTAVNTVMSAILGVIGDILKLIFDLFVKILSDIWQNVSDRFMAIWRVIESNLKVALTVTTTFLMGIFNVIKEKVLNAYNAVKEAFDNIRTKIETVIKIVHTIVATVFNNIKTKIETTVKLISTIIATTFTIIYDNIRTKLTNVYNTVVETFGKIRDTISNLVKIASVLVVSAFSGMYDGVKSYISNMYNSVKDGIANIYNAFTNWVSNLWDNVFGKFFGWISDGINKLREFFGLESEASNSYNSSYSTSGSSYNYGHATGGIFNREHVARFAEGNKAEAIIPLEEASAMKPFVDAVADGLTASLAPILANMGSNSQNMQPLYVGTLIADDRGLRELERKMEIIRLQESKR